MLASGAAVGSADANGHVRSADGTFHGTVADLRAVMAAGTLAGVYDAKAGTFRAASGPSAPVQASLNVATGVVLANGAMVGTAQGTPPPIAAVLSCAGSGSGSAVGWVAWATLEATADADGALLGCIAGGQTLPGGLVTAPMSRTPTSDLPQALDTSGNFLGYVMPNGAVMSASATPIGAVMPDGAVVGPGMAALGAVNIPAGAIPGTAVVGFSGQFLGTLQLDGRVVSPVDGSLQGLCTPSCRIISPSGQYIAYLPALASPMHALSSESTPDAAVHLSEATPVALAATTKSVDSARAAATKSVDSARAAATKSVDSAAAENSEPHLAHRLEPLQATGRLNSAERQRGGNCSRTGSGRSSSGRRVSRKATPKVWPGWLVCILSPHGAPLARCLRVRLDTSLCTCCESLAMHDCHRVAVLCGMQSMTMLAMPAVAQPLQQRQPYRGKEVAAVPAAHVE
jgi:hypothetical protein